MLETVIGSIYDDILHSQMWLGDFVEDDVGINRLWLVDFRKVIILFVTFIANIYLSAFSRGKNTLWYSTGNLTLKASSKIAADNTFIFLPISLEENEAWCFTWILC